jgi:DNA-directed RNA polymerase specialized sigma24 family protein
MLGAEAADAAADHHADHHRYMRRRTGHEALLGRMVEDLVKANAEKSR